MANTSSERPSLNMLMRRSWDRPTERDWADVLGALPLFSQLSKRQLRALAKSAKVADHPSGEPRSSTITAKDRVRTMKLPRRAFLKAVDQDPKIGLAIMEALAQRVRRLERGSSA